MGRGGTSGNLRCELKQDIWADTLTYTELAGGRTLTWSSLSTDDGQEPRVHGRGFGKYTLWLPPHRKDKSVHQCALIWASVFGFAMTERVVLLGCGIIRFWMLPTMH